MNECAKWSTILSTSQVLLGFASYQYTGSSVVIGFAVIWVLLWVLVFSSKRVPVLPYAANAAAWANVAVLLAVLCGAVAQSLSAILATGGVHWLFTRYFIVGIVLFSVATLLFLYWFIDHARAVAETFEDSVPACFAVLLPYFVGTICWGFITLWRIYRAFVRPQTP